MFERLLIQNFQKHEKLKVDFDPNLTVIVGQSDVGKSSIIRALRWLCFNVPQGDSFIKDGEDGTSVKLFVDGRKVTRRRGKSTNEYLLDDAEYKAFGSGVPDDIANFLRLDPLNFQSQHDSPFWLSLTPGEVSKRLNAIVDLEIIDSSLTKIKSEVQVRSAQANVAKSRLDEAKDKKSRLQWIETAALEYDAVEEIESAAIQVRREIDLLRHQIEKISKIQDEMLRKNSMLVKLNGIGRAGAAAKKLGHRVHELRRSLEAAEKEGKLAGSDPPDVSALQEIVTEIVEAGNRCVDLRTRINQANRTYTRITGLQSELERIEEQIHEKCGGICPVCGGEFNG